MPSAIGRQAAAPPTVPLPATQSAAGTVAPPSGPSAQIAAAITRIGADGTLALHLHPADLGEVRITISNGVSGATVAVAVTRPQTLQLLQLDQPALHHALTQAGVPAAGRSVSLSLQPGGGGDAGPGGAGEFGRGGGQAQQHRPRPRASVQRARTASIWRRIGVDITA